MLPILICTSMTDTPPAKKSPALKIFLGCGCLAVIVLAGLLGTAIYYGTKVVKTDPEDIAAFYSEIALGAEVPAGFKAQMGIDWSEVPIVSEDFKVAVLASDDGYSISAMQFPASIADEMQFQAQPDKPVTTESETIGKCTIGDIEVEVSRVEMADKDGSKSLAFEFAFPASDDNRALRFVFSGPMSGFDKARVAAYFKTIPGADPSTLPLGADKPDEIVEEEPADVPQADAPQTKKPEGK